METKREEAFNAVVRMVRVSLHGGRWKFALITGTSVRYGG